MTRGPPKPLTSPKPLPTPLAMSAAPNSPTASPLPFRSSKLKHQRPEDKNNAEEKEPGSTTRPHPKPTFPKCKIRLICQDLDHAGANVFFSHNNPSTSISKAVDAVLSTLYKPTKTNDHITPTRSVSVTLRSMSGVAYTTGSDIDDDHKEIHFSLDYIRSINSERQEEEIQGVLVHEMVHCWQWDGIGTAPGGLIEGIADYVRLKAGLSPPHWKKENTGKWDSGYQHTGYFLEWIENKWGDGSVRKVNNALKDKEYIEEDFWEELFGKKVEDLWSEYSEDLLKLKPKEKEFKPESVKQEQEMLSNFEDGTRKG